MYDNERCLIFDESGNLGIAADYVDNGLYANYEYSNEIYEVLIRKKVNVVQHFPYKNFGK